MGPGRDRALLRWNDASARKSHHRAPADAQVLVADPGATLDDLREAVETLEETEPIVRRILGGANPTLVPIVRALRAARAKLNAREPPNT